MKNIDVGVLDKDLEDVTVFKKVFEGKQMSVCLKDVSFENCVFRGVDFSDIVFDGVSFEDVIFEDCDLSNKVFDERLMRNVLIKNSKLIGASFISSFLTNVTFESVSARYINMSFSKINGLKIVDSDFTESSFIDVRLKKLELSNVIFNNSEFLKTSLRGVNFCNCSIALVMFDLMSVRGMIIDQFQCQDVVNLLGIIVN